MVMKVGNINPLFFKGSALVSKPDNKPESKPEIKEIPNTMPDFSIKTPQKYSNLGITELPNGLKMHSYKLANGHRVSIIPMEDSPAVVKNYVNVGSMNETDDIKGISHFLEHMAFNGTDGNNGHVKLEQGDSFQKIDRLGGWTNASTNYALTDYVNSTPQLDDKDLEEQIKIIAAMTEDLSLNKLMIEKEKGPVCSEINMILDNPQTVLMDQTVRSLFNIKSSADELVGGSTKHIKDLTREKVKNYYDTYYTPDNMNLVITGDVEPDKVIELVSKNFHSNKKSSGNKYETELNPINKTIRKDFLSDKATSSEIMLGFAGPKSNDTKSKILFEIAQEYLDSNSLGINKALKEYNTCPITGMEKISTNPNNPTIIYYTASCAEDNSEEVLKTIFKKLANIKSISPKELNIIKERLLQDYKNGLQYSANVNDMAGNSIINGNTDYFTNYESILNDITPSDLDNFNKKYLDINKTALTVVHPSFKGHKKPVNSDKISEQTLSNNYKAAFYKTKNDNIYFNINLKFAPSKNINPAAIAVLSEIYSTGTLNKDEDEFEQFKENNNIKISAVLNNNSLDIYANSSLNKFKDTSLMVKELLEQPRITDEDFEKAVNSITDRLSRKKDSAVGLYIDNEAGINPLYSSKYDILDGLKTLTKEDVADLQEYIMQNAKGSVTMNLPEGAGVNTGVKEEALANFENLRPVKPYNCESEKVYKPTDEVTVLTKDNAVSQADIMQLFKFPLENTAKENAVSEIMNTILTNSASIGLFNTLREKEHLAYSVYSNIDRLEDCGELSLHILTTTDNKEIGEIEHENVQKSINGFNRQIKELLDDKYSDDDLESAKRILKANLLQKEGVQSKLDSLNKGLKSKEGIEYDNKLFDIIDSITREAINQFAQKVFMNKPIYSIVASKDTLEANKDYFESLKI